jgi:N-acetylmuramoyl-L-alanine amidase
VERSTSSTRSRRLRLTRTPAIGLSALLVLIATASGACSSSSKHAIRASTSTAAKRPATTTSSTVATTTSTAAPTTTRATTPPTAPPPTVPPTIPATAAPPSSGSLQAVAGKTIVIDAGHNGGNGSHPSEISRPIFIGTGTRACDTVGTQSASGYPEHAYTLDVALRVRDLLAGAGANVVMVRTTDTGVGPCIDQRAYIGNNAHAAVGVSIHADGGPTTGRGFCAYMPANVAGYTDDIYAASHRLGIAIRDVYGAASGIPPATYVCANGLAEADNYGGLNLSNVPKVLFETANMRSAADAAVLEQAAGRQRIAQGIALGLARYLAG